MRAPFSKTAGFPNREEWNLTEKMKGFLSSAVAWAAAAWIFLFTRNLSSGTNDLIKPAFVPRVVAVGLVLLGIGLFIQALRINVSDEEKKALEEKKTERKEIPLIERLTPFLTLVLIFLFLFFLKKVGFTVCATVYLTLQMTLLSGNFSWKSWLKYFVIALVASVAILFIFRYGFKLKLPVNQWKF